MKSNHAEKRTSFSTAASLSLGSKLFYCGALALSLLGAGKANAQIFTQGFEGVVASGASANNGGATGNGNLGISSTSWTTTGSFVTFTGNTPTPGTALALATSVPTTQTWTLNVPVNGCYVDSVNKISYNYRSTGTSYNFLTVKVNGTTVSAGSINANSNWQTVNTTFATITNSSTLTVQFIMSGGTHGAGGTFRLDNVNIFGGVYLGGSSCSGTPTAGSVSVGGGATSFCGTGSSTLSLTGATSGCGIKYQWQKSVGGAPFTATSTADTNLTFNTGSISASTDYRVVTTCVNSGLTATSPAVSLTVDPIPANSPISSIPTPAIIGTPATLTNATPGGFWSSANTNIATIDGSGVLTPVFGGTATVSYVTIGSTGCQNIQTANVNVVWPNTLALYAGSNGTSTGVIPASANVLVNSLAYTGSLATTCGSGGFSGMTVPTSITTYNAANPHVFYTVKPTAGNALNVFRIAAKTRESGTGPTKARIAISRDGGATWAAQGTEQNLNTGGGCGSSANSWSLDSAITGIKDSILVAVYPYASGSSTGTFQLNTLEVYGVITSDADCNGTPANAGFITPTAAYICDSGSRFLSLDSGAFTGTAGVGISYQWQSSTTSATSGFSDIPGATNISYNTGKLYATSTPTVIYYQVKTLCNLGTPSAPAVSNTDTVNVNQTPSAGIISSLPNYLSEMKYSELFASYPPLTTTGATAGGTIWWRSNDTSSTAITDSATGDFISLLPGVSVITVLNRVGGCVGTAKDTIFAVNPGTIAAYTGVGGNSTKVKSFYTSILAASDLTQTGYGVATACGFGGLSGLTNNGVSTYSSTGARASFKLVHSGTGTTDIDGFHATLRRSNSGIQTVRLAYKLNSSGWVDDAVDQTVNFDDCGYSTSEVVFGSSIVSISNSDTIEFGVFGYDPIAVGGTLQINTINIISNSTPLKPANLSSANVSSHADVKVFPNPASTTLNIAANGSVNAVVMSLDGKVLIDQKDAKSIGINHLANGMYFIKLYDENNALIKTTKFTKQ